MRLKRSNVAPRVCVLVSFCVLVATAVMAVPAHAALPEGRTYEMVTPPDKGGYSATQEVFYVAPDGESVAFGAVGAFSGEPSSLLQNTYVARRGPAGWGTEGIDPPATFAPGITVGAADYSWSLSDSLTEQLGIASSFGRAGEASEEAFYKHDLSEPDTTQSFVQASPLLKRVTSGPPEMNYLGAAADLSHIFVMTSFALLAGEVDDPPGTCRIYDAAGTGSLQLVVDGAPCGSPLGSGNLGSMFHAISKDGTVVFADMIGGGLVAHVGGASPSQVGLGSVTFQGASEDGSKVFYTSGSDLYMAVIAHGDGEPASVKRLVLISHAVQGVVRISDDGAYVYFVAAGVLAPGGVVNADNLYAYDTNAPQTKFVAELCSGLKASGSVGGVVRCPGSGSDQELWQEQDFREAQVNGCLAAQAGCEAGRYLAFSTYAQLIASGPEADTDTAKDVYEYDALSGTMRRVSIAEAGSATNNGNSNGFDAAIERPRYIYAYVDVQHELDRRAVSDDGSKVVFKSAEPLSSRVSNEAANVYVWSAGRVGLISGGRSDEPAGQAAITPTGNDVFFATTEGLLPQDTDGVGDVYDARVGGGFPSSPVPASGCSTGAACRGLPGAPPSLIPAGSLTQLGESATGPSTLKAKAKPKHCKKGFTRKRGKCVKRKAAKSSKRSKRRVHRV
jgi:hypothetical protein